MDRTQAKPLQRDPTVAVRHQAGLHTKMHLEGLLEALGTEDIRQGMVSRRTVVHRHRRNIVNLLHTINRRCITVILRRMVDPRHTREEGATGIHHPRITVSSPLRMGTSSEDRMVEDPTNLIRLELISLERSIKTIRSRRMIVLPTVILVEEIKADGALLPQV